MTADCPSPAAFGRVLTRAVLLPPALLAALALIFLGQVAYLLSTARWVDHTDRVIAVANALRALIVDGETGVRGYLLTGDPTFLDPYRAEEARSGPAFDGLSALVSDNPRQVARLADLRAEHAGWRDHARDLVGAGRGAGRDAPARLADGKRRMDAIRAQVADFIRVEEELRQERTRAARRATWVVAGTSLALALLIGGALALATRRRLVRVSGTYRAALSAAEDRAESLRKSAHRLATLHDIDRAILADEDLPSLVGSALRQTERVVPGGDSFVVAFDPAGPRLLGRDRAAEADPALAGPAEATDHDGPKVAPDLEASAPTPLREHLLRAGHRSCVTVPLDSEGRRFGVLVLADPRKAAFTEEHRQVALEIARQLAIAFRQSAMREQVRRHAADLERRVEERTRELQDSLARVKQLQGLLPICAWCKRVRDGKDYWHQVEHYVAAHTGAQFSHGICPECRAAMEREAHSPAG